MKQIPLTQGKFALVDDEDFEYLSQWKWHITKTGYAARNLYVNHKRTDVFIHRLVSSPPEGMVVDHIDGNKLNNQRSNLRVCTQQQNMANRRLNKNNTSGYKGVSWRGRTGGGWRARVNADGRQYCAGTYETPKEAAYAYDRKAKELFGEFARLNFPAKG